jgi:hypothetical protein
MTSRGEQATPSRARLIEIAIGVVFVPVSILKSLSIVDFPGGRGLLPIADGDTIFQDATLLLMCSLLWVRRREIGTRLPLVIFSLTLSATTAILLGYVVTNFGTLFRIKYLVAAPVWLLSLSVARPSRVESGFEGNQDGSPASGAPAATGG